MMLMLALGLMLWLIVSLTVAVVTGRAAKEADDRVRIAALQRRASHASPSGRGVQ